MGATMKKIWIGLVIAVALTLVLAPARSQPLALPEPGARRIVAAIFGDAK